MCPQRLAYVGAWAKAAYVVRRSVQRRRGRPGYGDCGRSGARGSPSPGSMWSAWPILPLACSFISGAAAHTKPAISIFSVSLLSSFPASIYTGKLNGFDQVIYWGNLIAGWLAPALFLHFCLTFPEPRAWLPATLGLDLAARHLSCPARF